MKASGLCMVMLPLVTLLAGCCAMGGGYSSPLGSRPGSIVADGTYGTGGTPAFVRFEGTDVEVLGQVQAEGHSETTLGIISSGDNGYAKVLDAARKKYPDFNGVINLQYDVQYNNICGGALVERVTTKIEGTVIKYRNVKK